MNFGPRRNEIHFNGKQHGRLKPWKGSVVIKMALLERQDRERDLR